MPEEGSFRLAISIKHSSSGAFGDLHKDLDVSGSGFHRAIEEPRERNLDSVESHGRPAKPDEVNPAILGVKTWSVEVRLKKIAAKTA